MSDLKKVMVACTNASGEADFFVCSVDVTEGQYDLGVHYDLAKELASEAGYEEPFVCFDEHEQRNIARQVCELDCPIPFSLIDKGTDDSNVQKGTVVISELGVGINPTGYSDCCSQDDQGNIPVPVGQTQCHLFAFEVDLNASNDEITSQVDDFYYEKSRTKEFNLSELVSCYPYTPDAWSTIVESMEDQR